LIKKNTKFFHETYGLFPTPLASFDFSHILTTDNLNYAKKILEDYEKNMGNVTSKNGFVLELPQLVELKNFVNESLDIFMKEIVGSANAKVGVTQSWLNLTKKGEFHHQHSHANSIFSGVMYLHTSENDRIVFSRPIGQNSSYFLEVNSYNNFNSETWWMPASLNKMYIFPSWLRHEVPAIDTDERISLSFNTLPLSGFGTYTSKTFMPSLEWKNEL
jgi:uncharacterized protein (TIGR02466 family)